MSDTQLTRRLAASEAVQESVPVPEEVVRCASCGREPQSEEDPHDEWWVSSDGLGQAAFICPEH